MSFKNWMIEKWNSERFRRNFLAVSITIVVNVTITLLIGLLVGEELFIGFGLLFAPAFGGAFRAIVANKKDLLFITPIMFVLDVLLFVPLICIIVGYTSEIGEAMGLGALSGVMMIISNLVFVGLRILVEFLIKSNKAKSQIVN